MEQLARKVAYSMKTMFARGQRPANVWGDNEQLWIAAFLSQCRQRSDYHLRKAQQTTS
jgi:hypothetical protein